MKNSLSLAAALLLLSTVVWAAESSTGDSRVSPSPAGAVSLLYKNTDFDTYQPDNNQNIRPDFKLTNHTAEPIAYERLKVRYWFTAEQRYGEGMFIQKTYVSMGDENLLISMAEVSSPREKSNYYVEYGFTAGAGSLAANATTLGWIRTLIRKTDYSKFNELDDYSYLAPGPGAPNEKMTVYLDGVLVYGTEPAEVPVMEDLRISFSNGNATGGNQIMLLPKFLNYGNTAVPLASIKLRYWFSEDDAFPFRYIEHYVSDETIETQGVVVGFEPERQQANHYLELSFEGSPHVLGTYRELRGFKLKLTRGLPNTREDFTNTYDDYSYAPGTNEYTYVANERVTLYIDGVLVWGIEPPVIESLTAEAQSLEAAQLYPVPARTTASLTIPKDNPQVGSVTIVDFSGRKRNILHTVEDGKIVFDISQLERGMYSVNAEINRKSYRKRLMVD
jgi:hypothetical protein